jgi:hypothetical protein
MTKLNAETLVIRDRVSLPQANHGGIKGKLPKSLAQDVDEDGNSQKRRCDDDDPDVEADEEDLNQSDNGDEPDIEMNWNLAHYLPEAGACQTNFTVSLFSP